MESNKSTPGELLSFLIDNHQLNMADFAKEIGIDLNELNAILNNKAMIPTEVVAKLCSRFKVFPEAFNRNNMKTETINWYNDYVINETINESVGTIIGAYSRLITKHEEHKDVEKWKKSEQMWIEFERSLVDLFIPTKEEAEKLMNDICRTSRELLELEKSLNPS